MAERYGPEAGYLMVRSSRFARDDGLRLGLRLGADCTRGMSSFYGHTMPSVARDRGPHEYKSLTLQVASRSVLVNVEGDRFTDESSGIVEEDNAYDAMYQPGDSYFLLCDSTSADKLPFARLDALAAERGPAPPPYIVENTTDDLVRSMERAWSVPSGPLVATISADNRCAVVGDGSLMSPPRSVPPAGLLRPRQRTTRAVLKAFADAQAAVALVQDMRQVAVDEQYNAIGAIVPVDDEELGAIRMPNVLFRLSKTPGRVRHAGRSVGMDTRDVLADAGFSAGEIDEYVRRGVVR